MKKNVIAILLAACMLLALTACAAKAPAADTASDNTAADTAPAETPAATKAPVEATEAPAEAPAESAEITVTDLIGREITVTPGSYRRVVCIGAGALTYLIRRFGGYPEGVSIAILTMNLLTPFIGDLTKRKTLGGVK